MRWRGSHPRIECARGGHPYDLRHGRVRTNARYSTSSEACPDSARHAAQYNATQVAAVVAAIGFALSRE